MKIYNFVYNGLFGANMAIGSNASKLHDKCDLTMIRVKVETCSGFSVRLSDGEHWHNFGAVQGFELCTQGSDTRQAFINLMKNLIAQDEAERAGVEIKREATSYNEDLAPNPLYFNLEYTGEDDEPDNSVANRMLSEDTELPPVEKQAMLTELDRALIAVCEYAAPPCMKDAIINVADTLRLAHMTCSEHLPQSPTNADVLAVCQMILAERERLVQADSAEEE